MADTTVRWEGIDGIQAALDEYGRKIHQAAFDIADYFAPVLETYAKQNAPWEDRTANARQTLRGWADELGNDAAVLYLAHGMEYGIYLETRWAGRYAILWPTIEAHLNEITARLQQVFG